MSLTNGNNHYNGIGTRRGLQSVDLKEQSIKTGTITLTEQFLSNIIHMASVIVLARLLTPEDYGIVAMVTAATGFVNVFREFGLSSATIQSKFITHEQVSALFWINTGVGALITVIIAALGPVVAWFYHKPELTLVTAGISLTSVIISLGTQHRALLARQLRFGRRAIINLTAMLAGFIVAITIAIFGGRYWALVANLLVVAICQTIGLWFASGFIPGGLKKGTDVRPLLRFGANIAGSNIFNYFHRNMDNILIGRAWGAEQLGLYSKAYALLMLPISNLRYPLHRVAFAVMSRIQDDPEQLRRYFIRYCSILAFITMPVVVFFFVCSENVIRLLLGPRWMGAVELFSILAFASFIEPVAAIRSTILLALGRGGRYFRWTVYNGIAIIAAFFVGLPWGARGVAIAYAVVTYLILHPTLVYAFHDTPVRCSDFYRSIAKPFLASILMCVITLVIKSSIHVASDIVILSVLLIISVLVYIGIYWVLPGGKREVIDFWGYATLLLQSLRNKFSKENY